MTFLLPPGIKGLILAWQTTQPSDTDLNIGGLIFYQVLKQHYNHRAFVEWARFNKTNVIVLKKWIMTL